MRHTKENIEKLAEDVLDSWDWETTLVVAKQKLIDEYTKNKDLFKNDVTLMYMG